MIARCATGCVLPAPNGRCPVCGQFSASALAARAATVAEWASYRRAQTHRHPGSIPEAPSSVFDRATPWDTRNPEGRR